MESLDEIFDEVINLNDSNKVIELDDVALLEIKRKDSHVVQKERTKSQSGGSLSSLDGKRLTRSSTDSLPSPVSDYVIKREILDEFNFESVVDKISTIGINPTAL